jgi:hypothetical protein
MTLEATPAPIRDGAILLRADTREALQAALPWAVQQDSEPEGLQAGDWIEYGPDYWLLVIGSPLVIKDAVMGEPDPETGEAEVIEPAELDTGYHANLYPYDGFDRDVPDSVIVTPAGDQVRVAA